MTTIKVSKDTVKRLKSKGQMGDTFDDVINKVLDEIEVESKVITDGDVQDDK